MKKLFKAREEYYVGGVPQYLYGGFVPEPNPTPTISVTPTISITPTITPTISFTPSMTPTISITPTLTRTPTTTPTISLTPTLTRTPSQSVFSYLGRTLVDAASFALACSTYLVARSYQSNKSLPLLTTGDFLYDTFPSSPTNGGGLFVALKVGGVGTAYWFQVASDGEILDNGVC